MSVRVIGGAEQRGVGESAGQGPSLVGPVGEWKCFFFLIIINEI